MQLFLWLLRQKSSRINWNEFLVFFRFCTIYLSEFFFCCTIFHTLIGSTENEKKNNGKKENEKKLHSFNANVHWANGDLFMIFSVAELKATNSKMEIQIHLSTLRARIVVTSIVNDCFFSSFFVDFTKSNAYERENLRKIKREKEWKI